MHAPYGVTPKERPSFGVDNPHVFRVAWRDGRYPKASEGCSAVCELRQRASGDSCLCDVRVETSRIFDAPPSRAEVEASCRRSINVSVISNAPWWVWTQNYLRLIIPFLGDKTK